TQVQRDIAVYVDKFTRWITILVADPSIAGDTGKRNVISGSGAKIQASFVSYQRSSALISGFRALAGQPQTISR
ncbi:MAG TPA: hypothetical protein VME43_12845, partial [Bryobacteraceae bacterium]|nr:hypothetical protein [Bryobacteraceae bacterium]